MSVDFYNCDICSESLTEYECCARVIDFEEIYVCDYCMEDMLENKEIIVFSSGISAIDDENFDNYSDEIKDIINDYSLCYEYTNIGLEKRIKQLEVKNENISKTLKQLKKLKAKRT